MVNEMSKNTVHIKLVRSTIGCVKKQKATIRGLGLNRIGSTSVLEDTPAVQGMVNKVKHMLEVS